MSKNSCWPILAGPFGSFFQARKPHIASPPQAEKRSLADPSSRIHIPVTSLAIAGGADAAKNRQSDEQSARHRSILRKPFCWGAGRLSHGRGAVNASIKRLRPERPIAALERGDGRGRGQDVDDGVGLERRRRAIAGEAPRQKRARAHGVGAPDRARSSPRPAGRRAAPATGVSRRFSTRSRWSASSIASTPLGAPGKAAIKAFAACRRHSKHGRWPAASAVGSSRKKSSV